MSKISFFVRPQIRPGGMLRVGQRGQVGRSVHAKDAAVASLQQHSADPLRGAARRAFPVSSEFVFSCVAMAQAVTCKALRPTEAERKGFGGLYGRAHFHQFGLFLSSCCTDSTDCGISRSGSSQRR